MQESESNRAKASKETHQAPKRFVSDVSVSFLSHSFIVGRRVPAGICTSLICVVSVDGLEIHVCVDDVGGNH